MNKGTRESHYEGWLIKSPPTKRMWRARWRRRWFTLKQGEIPHQFCLEYYTDRNCRKLKGVIDLDQCEQVDCGLRLENRKQKFQYMFDIKTPKRTYYLAADTEADMRDWVNCICQVCHLHDTKQSNELQDESRTQNTASTANTYSTNNTTTTSLNSSTGPPSAVASGVGATGQSFNSGILRRSDSGAAATLSSGVVQHQPQSSNASATYQTNSTTDCAYVNTEYTNRETLLCETHFNRQQLASATASVVSPTEQHAPTSPGAASLYLNSAAFQALHASQNETSSRLAVNVNGVVRRKIPENLVLNSTPLPESQQHSVQPSPALSTCSGPYIPISECYSGSPKFMLEANNPTTPLNNLDPKFYDTPRSHNNIGLNLTNDDQSYSPKITNCSLQQMAAAKNRSHRSDSDSESVFTDDDEWTHPLPLRVNVDRSTRPSDSSVENESFVLTYSQRFSKFPDDPATSKEQQKNGAANTIAVADPLEKLAKVLKNKNNLILDFKENEKIPRDMPQLSDTENTSPAIGPRDATSVVEESYDIPRSHHLPYYNMGQLFEKVASPETNPIAASTPNLMAGLETAPGSAALVRTLPRKHCYTNAAPSQVEGNVFNYDFIEQVDLPPVNRRLKPKGTLEDRPPEELPAKPPTAAAPFSVDALATKLMTTSIQSPGACSGVFCGEILALRPPSVDRKLKPNAYKFGNSALSPGSRRSTGAPLSMVLSNNGETYIYGNTLPRPNYATSSGTHAGHAGGVNGGAGGITIQHQRTASAAAAMQLHQIPLLQPPPKNEHKLQYFDLDVANPPTINRQLSVGNIYTAGGSRLGLGSAIDTSARAPVQSGIVYNSVDFVKTEAFKRIREERKKESEGVNSSSK